MSTEKTPENFSIESEVCYDVVDHRLLYDGPPFLDEFRPILVASVPASMPLKETVKALRMYADYIEDILNHIEVT
jgi:hypothetical protein